MITQRNLMTMGLTYFVDVDPIDESDAMVYAAPMSHGCGLYAIPYLMAGARHVVQASGGVDPVELFALGRALGPLSTSGRAACTAPWIVKPVGLTARPEPSTTSPRRLTLTRFDALTSSKPRPNSLIRYTPGSPGTLADKCVYTVSSQPASAARR